MKGHNLITSCIYIIYNDMKTQSGEGEGDTEKEAEAERGERER